MTILVAVGDDDRVKSVLDVGVRLTQAFEQDLIVAHVTANETASGDDRSFRQRIRTFLSDMDAQAKITLKYLDRSSLRSGTAIGKQLVDIAEGVEIEHIVVGYRSKDQLGELREGHTGFTVAKSATVPVTIVPEAVQTD